MSSEAQGGGYEIIAGERRWRAAQCGGLKTVPVVVREASRQRDTAELSLIENIQSAELNPLEEAEAYQILQDKFALSQEDISSRVGKDRSTVTNSLRLLKSIADRKEIPGEPGIERRSCQGNPEPGIRAAAGPGGSRDVEKKIERPRDRKAGKVNQDRKRPKRAAASRDSVTQGPRTAPCEAADDESQN